MKATRLRIKLRAYDHSLLDSSVNEIVQTAKDTGARVAGPIPLPTAVNKFTVLRSPHKDKKSREQFEMRTHKRMIDILFTRIFSYTRIEIVMQMVPSHLSDGHMRDTVLTVCHE